MDLSLGLMTWWYPSSGHRVLVMATILYSLVYSAVCDVLGSHIAHYVTLLTMDGTYWLKYASQLASLGHRLETL